MSNTSRRDLAALSTATAAIAIAMATEVAAQPAFPQMNDAEAHLG